MAHFVSDPVHDQVSFEIMTFCADQRMNRLAPKVHKLNASIEIPSLDSMRPRNFEIARVGKALRDHGVRIMEIAREFEAVEIIERMSLVRDNARFLQAAIDGREASLPKQMDYYIKALAETDSAGVRVLIELAQSMPNLATCLRSLIKN